MIKGTADSNDEIGARVVTCPACGSAQKPDHKKQQKLLLRVPIKEEPLVENLRESLGMHKDAGIIALLASKRKWDAMLIETGEIGPDEDDFSFQRSETSHRLGKGFRARGCG